MYSCSSFDLFVTELLKEGIEETDLLKEGIEEDCEGCSGEDGGDGVADTEDRLLLIIWPGQVSNPALDVDQQ